MEHRGLWLFTLAFAMEKVFCHEDENTYHVCQSRGEERYQDII